MSEHTHEPVPYRTFILIWVALLLLTAITVAVSRIDLGALNIWGVSIFRSKFADCEWN